MKTNKYKNTARKAMQFMSFISQAQDEQRWVPGHYTKLYSFPLISILVWKGFWNTITSLVTEEEKSRNMTPFIGSPSLLTDPDTL